MVGEVEVKGRTFQSIKPLFEVIHGTRRRWWWWRWPEGGGGQEVVVRGRPEAILMTGQQGAHALYYKLVLFMGTTVQF